MAVQSYVIVSTDNTDLVIKAGPILWDGQTTLTLPSGTKAILSSAAGAYSFPPPSAAVTNTATLQSKASSALDTNITYLAIASPTNAQVTAQVKALTRECTALIRLLLGQLDTTDGA